MTIKRKHNRTLTAQMVAAATLTLAVALLALPGIAQAETCPNEQLRVENHSTSLPDCRAYEMVSPPFKYGNYITWPGNNPAIAADGARIMFGSIGAFNEPGDDGGELGGQYVDGRGEGGWDAQAVNPSATEFHSGGVPTNKGGGLYGETLDANHSLTQTLFLQAPNSGKPIDLRFYLRDPSGAYTQIGPAYPSRAISEWSEESATREETAVVKYRGASQDLSHVFFGIVNENGSALVDFHWPGDETRHSTGAASDESLYEYSGVGNSEPELVGVANQTSLIVAAREQGKDHLDEAAEMLGECGTFLGGHREINEPFDTYNAISRSGDTAFVTVVGHDAPGCEPAEHAPEVSEVYARLDRDHTVAISEPTTGPGGDCELCDESSKSPAIFQGASADGSRVFFITEQHLLSGAEGDSLYEYDFAGPEHDKVRLVAPNLSPSEGEPGGVVRVAEEGSCVYFVSTAALPGVSISPLGTTPHSGGDNLYRYQTNGGATQFIATLAPQDEGDWRGTDTRPVEATEDGRFLLFPSAGALTADASGEGNQLYRYEAPSPSIPSGSLVRVTVTSGGFNDDGNSVSTEFPFAPEYAHLGRGYNLGEAAVPLGVSMSTDGSSIFFESPLALIPGALDDSCAFEAFGSCFAAAQNIYEWHEGEVHLVSDGHDSKSLFDSSASRLMGATPSGSDVFFSTADPLVTADTDTQVDVYDAHVDGGLPAGATANACEGEACQGAAVIQPPPSVPGSATFSGLGNLGAAPAAKAVVKPKALTRAQKLAEALRACKKRTRKKRVSCEARAREKYGAKPKAKAKSKKSSRRSK